MGCEHDAGRSACGGEQDRIDSGRLRRAGKLAESGFAVYGEELQHLRRGAEKVGTVLGGQHWRQHFLSRRASAGWSDGLLEGCYSAEWGAVVAEAPAIYSDRHGQSAASQQRIDRWREDVERGV